MHKSSHRKCADWGGKVCLQMHGGRVVRGADIGSPSEDRSVDCHGLEVKAKPCILCTSVHKCLSLPCCQNMGAYA